jgi:hypothetical protein
LFKISNLVLGLKVIVTDMYSSLEEGGEEREREREKASKTRGDYATYDTETAIRK